MNQHDFYSAVITKWCIERQVVPLQLPTVITRGHQRLNRRCRRTPEAPNVVYLDPRVDAPGRDIASLNINRSRSECCRHLDAHEHMQKETKIKKKTQLLPSCEMFHLLLLPRGTIALPKSTSCSGPSRVKVSAAVFNYLILFPRLRSKLNFKLLQC